MGNSDRQGLVSRIMRLRREAQEAGMTPQRLECSANDAVKLGGVIFAGSRIVPCEGPGLAVLAWPPKVGRYQVVPPTRFEVAA